MKTTENYLSEISEIRKMMEGSSRFLSLSGLSGVLTGIYALVAAYIAHRMINVSTIPTVYELDYKTVYQLIFFALGVLFLSLTTVTLLTIRRAKKSGNKIWNPGSRLMLLNLAIPLISGGIFMLIFILRGNYEIAAPGCLIFYGLALLNAAKFTRQEIFFMGLFQIILGIFAALSPSQGLLFWALGFGVIHIVYGTLMYFRYEYKTNE